MTWSPSAVAAMTAAISVGAATACSAGPATNPVSRTARQVLTERMLALVDGDGIPVEDDHIHCSGSLDGRSDTCSGLTASEPVQRIKGVFIASAPGASGGSGCAGTLTVTIGPPIGYLDSSGPVQPLASEADDPCR